MSPNVLNDLVAHLLNTIERDPSVAPSFSRLSSNEDVWQSLVFCILSSQVRTSVAAKATQDVIEEVRFFDAPISCDEVYRRAKIALIGAKYRFPDLKSRQIASSWFAFAQIKEVLYEFLDSFSTELEAREAIARLFPGVGFKQASMFLRDVGYASRLCVIDTHLLWYCGRMGRRHQGAMTARKYLEIEEFLLGQSDALGVCPRVFDSAIWVAVTTIKARQCTMQFV